MVERFLAYSRVYGLFSSEDRVLLAVSGGVDSVVMADLFSLSGVDFGLAHCNFQLRGKDSLADADFVAVLAENLGAEVFIRDFETKKYAKQKGVSIQMAARTLRYDWFRSLAEKEGYGAIATAHHRNDALETVLLNLVRGTGIAGLHGIPIRSGNLIRPLGFATREMIEGYAETRGLDWREDSSNHEDKYSRNLIRNKVVPLLKKINPDLENTMAQNTDRLASVEAFFEQQVEVFKEKAVSHAGDVVYIDKEELRDMGRAAGAVLGHCLAPYGFTYQQVVSILTGLGGQSGRVFLSTTHQLNIDRGQLILSLRHEDSESGGELDGLPGVVTLGNHCWQKYVYPKPGYRIRADREIAALDFDLLCFPLKVRKWEAGDYFFPLGMRGKKKLSDFMIDEKIPLNLKKRLMVLCSGEDIVWVAGHRIDDRFKVSPKTKKIFEITLKAIEDD